MKPWPYPTYLENLAWSALIELEAVRHVHGVSPGADANIRGLRAELEYLLDQRWERRRMAWGISRRQQVAEADRAIGRLVQAEVGT